MPLGIADNAARTRELQPPSDPPSRSAPPPCRRGRWLPRRPRSFFSRRRAKAVAACQSLLLAAFGAWAGAASLHGQAATPAAAAAAEAGGAAAFGRSLVLRMDRIVADSSRTTFGWLSQAEAVNYTSQGALELRVALAPWEGEPKAIRELGSFTVYGGDLARHPFPFSAAPEGVPDGYYRWRIEVWDGGTRLAALTQPVVFAAGLEGKRAEFTRRLAAIDGHESAKASILYPFDLARTINLGRRVYGSAARNPEFGLSQAGVPQLYDFSAGLKKSAALLDELAAGRDPVWRARGDRVRHYYLPEADEILPYHVVVPASWDGQSKLPLVFILHGNSRDQDFYFERDGGIIPRNAEKHGFMLVCPLGYSPNGGYNYVPFDRERGPRGADAAAAAPHSFGTEAKPTDGVNGSVTPALVRSEWSEQDARQVLALVRQEYPIDSTRIFLLGYSAGGQGAHYFAQKYAEDWAAIAIGGSNATPGVRYDFGRVRPIPMMLFVGGADTPNVAPTHALFQALKQHGVDVVLHEYPGATHDTAPSAATPDIFDFFAARARP